jgi:chromosome segregation ATPase
MVLAGTMGALAQQAPVARETIEALEARVTALKERIESSGKLIASKRQQVETLQRNISAAAKDTDLLIAKFKEMAAEFQTGGATHTSMTNALVEIDKYIIRFKGGSKLQREAAKSLEASRDTIKAADGRRNALLERALAEIRKLEANKQDIEALIVVGNYKALAAVYTEMLDGFEAVVNEATAVNRGIDTAAKSLGGRPTD